MLHSTPLRSAFLLPCDLRKCRAGHALAVGEGLPIIGKLDGHSNNERTARYAHLAPDSVREAAERIAGSISADIL